MKRHIPFFALVLAAGLFASNFASANFGLGGSGMSEGPSRVIYK